MILSPSNKHVGSAAEEVAYQYLIKQGLKPIVRNYACKLGEIDLIMEDARSLVFVEVRYRKQITYGSPFESVNFSKQQKLIKTAKHYLQKQRSYCTQACRFDVVAIVKQAESYNVDWLKDAFQVS